MRRGVFLDSSGWYATLDHGDTNHAAGARRFARLVRERRPLITTNHVVSETYTLLMRRAGPAHAQRFLREIRPSPILERVHVPESWERAAEELLFKYSEQHFSYVDATSFVTMGQLGLNEVLTFDRDFMVAGFALVGDR